MDLQDNTTRIIVADEIAGDRREDRRYPMRLELKYKLIRRRRVLETGGGWTVDVSSGGILLESDRPMPAGLNVELSIAWPVLLQNVAPLRLVVSGRIVRSQGNRAAIRTVQHEFRTQGGQTAQIEQAGRNRVSGPAYVPAPPPFYRTAPLNLLNKSH